MRKQTSLTKSLPADPVTKYAVDVVSGVIVAGPHVRNACQRHLNDVETGKKRGLVWNPKIKTKNSYDPDNEVDRIISFYKNILSVEVEYDEDGESYSKAVPFVLEPSQAFIVGSIFGWKRRGLRRFRRAYVEIGKGNGKALSVDTPIPTHDGWKNMGDIVVGDIVFDENGNKCNVLATSGVMYDHDCYRVTFSCGGEIVADADHIWNTSVLRSGGKKGPKQKGEPRKGKYSLKTTEDISKSVIINKGSKSKSPQAKYNHRVDVAGAIDCDRKQFVVEPYTLGVWLGDGDSDAARITVDRRDWGIVNEIELDGYSVDDKGKKCEPVTRVLVGSGGRSQKARDNSLQAKLRSIGVLCNKHIPTEYLRGDFNQRLSLLQGLMDSDGSALKDGASEFSSCNKRLSDDVVALMRTIGLKPMTSESDAKINGRVVGRRWRTRVHAYSDMHIFRLERKYKRQKNRPKTRPLSLGRMITACEKIESVPVQCITVDSPSGMFIAGDHMIPTHNSPLAAGIGHYMLTACRKLRAEVYSAATDKDQAAILFRDAVEMWNRSPELNAILVPSGQNPVWQLTYIIKASFFKPISSEKKGKSGIRPFCSLVDEIHEHKDNSVIEMLRAGTKGNREALMFEITNSGYDRQSVCYQEHEYSINVCNGSIKNDAWFAYVCALDEGDDPFNDEECWIKANPLLGVSIHKDFIREQVVEAKGIPDKQSLVKRLHFCIWAESNNPLISVEKWLELKQESIGFEPGEKIYLALDLAETTDLCALAAVSASGGDRVQVWFWKPKNVLKEHEDLDRVPYRRWVESGLIEACEGGAIEHRYIADKIMELGEEYEICGMAYDAWNIKYLVKAFNFIDFPHYVDKTGEKDGDGLRMIPWSQSFSDMSPAVNSIETSVANKKLQHDGHPVLTWNVSNATVVRDTSGNRKLDKRLARQRIDGMQALTMAIGLKYREVEKEEDIIDENPFMEIDFQ